MGKRHKRKKKNSKTENTYSDMYSDMDGNFAFIAGYTSGGAPYGVTWEEVGIDSELPFEEKVRLYRVQMSGSGDALEMPLTIQIPSTGSRERASRRVIPSLCMSAHRCQR